MIKVTSRGKKQYEPEHRELILLVGKSGSGKDYLSNALGLRKVVSRTTRPMRSGEENGVSHLFVTIQEMVQYPKNLVVAYTEFDGHTYCALRQDFSGKDVYIIDPVGVEYFLKHSSSVLRRSVRIVYVKCSNIKILRRLIKRDGFKNAIRRFKHDYKIYNEFEKKRKIDSIINN